MDVLDRLSRLSQNAAQALRVRSALNPMLWLTAIATPLCFGGAWIFQETPWVLTVCVIAALMPLTVATAGFVFFALSSPEKLQSEEYQLRHETLEIIQSRRWATAIAPETIERIASIDVTQIRDQPEK